MKKNQFDIQDPQEQKLKNSKKDITKIILMNLFTELNITSQFDF